MRRYIILSILVTVVTVFIYIQKGVGANPVEGEQTWSETELSEPTEFLIPMDPVQSVNPEGDHTFKGRLKNIASQTSYRNVSVRLSFLTKEGARLRSTSFVLTNDFLYGVPATFEINIKPPASAAKVRWEITGAEGY